MLGMPFCFSLPQCPRWHRFFSRPLPIWCLCMQGRSASAIGKQLISRKVACKDTENSFSLCINMKARKNRKEKAQVIFLHTSSSPYRNVTGDKVEDGRNRSGMCVCKSNDSKTSLAKHRKVDKVVKRTFQGKILFCLSGFLLCNGIVRAAIETTFYFWRQGRKEVASTKIRKHLSTPSTISIAHSHWKNSSYKMCYRLMKSILH